MISFDSGTSPIAFQKYESMTSRLSWNRLMPNNLFVYVSGLTSHTSSPQNIHKAKFTSAVSGKNVYVYKVCSTGRVNHPNLRIFKSLENSPSASQHMNAYRFMFFSLLTCYAQFSFDLLSPFMTWKKHLWGADARDSELWNWSSLSLESTGPKGKRWIEVLLRFNSHFMGCGIPWIVLYDCELLIQPPWSLFRKQREHWWFWGIVKLRSPEQVNAKQLKYP